MYIMISCFGQAVTVYSQYLAIVIIYTCTVHVHVCIYMYLYLCCKLIYTVYKIIIIHVACYLVYMYDYYYSSVYYCTLHVYKRIYNYNHIPFGSYIVYYFVYPCIPLYIFVYSNM